MCTDTVSVNKILCTDMVSVNKAYLNTIINLVGVTFNIPFDGWIDGRINCSFVADIHVKVCVICWGLVIDWTYGPILILFNIYFFKGWFNKSEQSVAWPCW